MARLTEYPKFVYHKLKGQQIVNSQDEQIKLGKGWSDVPFPAPVPAVEQVGGAEGLTARVERLEAMFDKLKTRKDMEKLFVEA